MRKCSRLSRNYRTRDCSCSIKQQALSLKLPIFVLINTGKFYIISIPGIEANIEYQQLFLLVLYQILFALALLSFSSSSSRTSRLCGLFKKGRHGSGFGIRQRAYATKLYMVDGALRDR